jgi:Tol biopolymer transport system component
VQVSQPTDGVLGPNFTATGAQKGIEKLTSMITKTFKVSWYPGNFLSVSPDKQSVAYIVRRNDQDNIFIRPTGGGMGGVQRTFGLKVRDLAYSHDGKSLVFTDSRDGNFNIYIMNSREGSAMRQVTTSTSDDVAPIFSKDDKTVYYAQSSGDGWVGAQGSGYGLWSYDLEKGIMTQLTEGRPSSLSPDGEKIYVTRIRKDEKALGEIWVIDLKTNQETLLISDLNKSYANPQISPDGTKIVAVTSSVPTKTYPGNTDIVVFNSDGSNLTQMTFHPSIDASPVWSADGKSIYFVSSRGNKDNQYSIWKIDL